jgi:hypothetical protein
VLQKKTGQRLIASEIIGGRKKERRKERRMREKHTTRREQHAREQKPRAPRKKIRGKKRRRRAYLKTTRESKLLLLRASCNRAPRYLTPDAPAPPPTCTCGGRGRAAAHYEVRGLRGLRGEVHAPASSTSARAWSWSLLDECTPHTQDVLEWSKDVARTRGLDATRTLRSQHARGAQA